MNTQSGKDEDGRAREERARFPAACAAVQESLTCAIDGRLSVAEKETLDRHLAGCPDCRHLLEEHRTAWKLLDAPPDGAPRLEDSEFLAVIRARARQGAAPLRLWIAAAAVFLLCGGLGWHWLQTNREESAVIENLLVLEDLASLPADAAGPEEDSGIPEVGRELVAMLQEGEKPPDEAASEVEDLLDLLDHLIEYEEKGG